jgi:hypothetical protein
VVVKGILVEGRQMDRYVMLSRWVDTVSWWIKGTTKRSPNLWLGRRRRKTRGRIACSLSMAFEKLVGLSSAEKRSFVVAWILP